jgi:PAS domain S-box-containing protein
VDPNRIFARQEYEEAFWDRAPLCSALFDPSGHFTRLNVAWTRLLGYAESELQGIHWSEITHPAEIEDCRKEFARITSSSTAKGFSMVLRFIAKAGGTVWLELHVSTIREPDGSLRELGASAIPLPNHGSFKVEQAGDGYAVRPVVRWADLVRDNPRQSIVFGLILLSLSGKVPFESIKEIIKSLLLP